MIKQSHFKQFKDLTMDFSDVRDYCFQQDCLTKHKKALIKTAVIYGPNGSGKSNLGFAILDIVQHLFDKNTQSQAYDYYLNADNPDNEAEFTYTFLFKEALQKPLPPSRMKQKCFVRLYFTMSEDAVFLSG